MAKSGCRAPHVPILRHGKAKIQCEPPASVCRTASAERLPHCKCRAPAALQVPVLEGRYESRHGWSEAQLVDSRPMKRSRPGGTRRSSRQNSPLRLSTAATATKPVRASRERLPHAVVRATRERLPHAVVRATRERLPHAVVRATSERPPHRRWLPSTVAKPASTAPGGRNPAPRPASILEPSGRQTRPAAQPSQRP